MGMFISLLQLYPLPFFFLSLTSLYFLHSIFSKIFRQPTESISSNFRPPTYPVIGCFISFHKNRHRLLDWYTELLSQSPTNTIIIQRIGSRRTIVTANPKNIEYILTTHFNNFPKGKPFTEILGDFLGDGIFNVDGELWRTQRKLVSHEFSAKSLRELVVKTLEDEVESQLLPLMESLAKHKKVEDLQDLLKTLSFNVICKISLGFDQCSLDFSKTSPQLSKGFDIASEICAKRGSEPLSIVWKIKRYLQIGSEKKLKLAVQQVQAYIMQIIQTRKNKFNEKKINGSESSDHDHQDLLSRLILAGHEEKLIRDMVINFIMAGRDTTSSAITWLFWSFSQNPEAEREVMKEIEFFRERKLKYEVLKELNFLNACICETMRIYPPVAWDSKHAVVSDQLPDGTHVGSGDRVTYFPYGMGRMESLWGSDRFEFRPSRWLTKFEDGFLEREVMRKVCRYKFPVFQAGPRVCLGKEMAFIQMKYVVGSILRRFRIKPVSLNRPVFIPLLTAHMAGGFKVLIEEKGERGR